MKLSQKELFIKSYRDWRNLPEDKQIALATLVIGKINAKKRHKEIEDELQISEAIITKLRETNGLASKGKFRGKKTNKTPNPIVHSIDVLPNADMLVRPDELEKLDFISNEICSELLEEKEGTSVVINPDVGNIEKRKLSFN